MAWALTGLLGAATWLGAGPTHAQQAPDTVQPEPPPADPLDQAALVKQYGELPEEEPAPVQAKPVERHQGFVLGWVGALGQGGRAEVGGAGRGFWDAQGGGGLQMFFAPKGMPGHGIAPLVRGQMESALGGGNRGMSGRIATSFDGGFRLPWFLSDQGWFLRAGSNMLLEGSELLTDQRLGARGVAGYTIHKKGFVLDLGARGGVWLAGRQALWNTRPLSLEFKPVAGGEILIAWTKGLMLAGAAQRTFVREGSIRRIDDLEGRLCITLGHVALCGYARGLRGDTLQTAGCGSVPASFTHFVAGGSLGFGEWDNLR